MAGSVLMRSVVALLLLVAGPARAGCEDVSQQLSWASEELLEVNPASARAALDAAELGLGCGEQTPKRVLATLFLLDGATAAQEGDPTAMRDAFAAAARIDPGHWIPSLGPKLRSEYEAAAAAPTQPSQIAVAAEGWTVVIDGEASESPASVVAGLHSVQVVDDKGVGFGRVVWLLPGELQALTPDLPIREVAAPVSAPVQEAPPAKASAVALSIGFGATAAFGEPLTGERDGDALSEPGVKLTLPLEVGVILRRDRLWIRPTVGLAPLIGGRFLFATDEGAGASGFALLADLAAGVEAGPVELGGSAGIAFPGRIALRALGALPLGSSPLVAELRAGVNAATGGRVEPAAGLSLSARLP